MFKCHLCNSAKSHTENISEVFQIDGKFHLVENIPTTVCDNCGETTLSRSTTEHIRSMLQVALSLLRQFRWMFTLIKLCEQTKSW